MINGVWGAGPSGYNLTERFKDASFYRRWRTKGKGVVDSKGRYHRPDYLGGPTHSMLWYELGIQGPGSEKLIVDNINGKDCIIFPLKYGEGFSRYKIFIPGNLVGRTSTKRLRRAEYLSMKELLTRAARKGKLAEIADSLLSDFPIFKDNIDKILKKPSLQRLNRKALEKAANKKGFIALLVGLFR